MMQSINYKTSSIEDRAYKNMKRIIYIEKLNELLGKEVEVIIDRPLKSFKGKVIAIINRLNDIEDKLIACDKKSNYTIEEIKKMVNFQEKYFKSKIIIKKF